MSSVRSIAKGVAHIVMTQGQGLEVPHPIDRFTHLPKDIASKAGQTNCGTCTCQNCSQPEHAGLQIHFSYKPCLMNQAAMVATYSCWQSTGQCSQARIPSSQPDKRSTGTSQAIHSDSEPKAD
jgi:hypothetical protein